MTSTTSPATAFPYALTRVGVVMTPDPDDPFEAEGVLNPASGRGPDGELYLLPRLVAAGNVSRIGIARILVEDGVPVGVERQGVVLAPDRPFERGLENAGVEDPRITFIDALGLHVMTYVAYGPVGPRSAIAVSSDLREWRRLGPVHFAYDDDLGVDLSLFPNKDTLFFPEAVPGPDGTPCYAALHRPTWELGIAEGIEAEPPAQVTDRRAGIWISYVPVEEVERDVANLVRWRWHRQVALSEHAFEELKIGGGPVPLRVPEGWLLIHHGVVGTLEFRVAQQKDVFYSAGAMILDADDPSRVLRRTSEPLLSPETADETDGIVANVVFPTTIERIDGVDYVFYGMADSAIGVARLDRTA